jgi:hypothetical protein
MKTKNKKNLSFKKHTIANLNDIKVGHDPETITWTAYCCTIPGHAETCDGCQAKTLDSCGIEEPSW